MQTASIFCEQKNKPGTLRAGFFVYVENRRLGRFRFALVGAEQSEHHLDELALVFLEVECEHDRKADIEHPPHRFDE